MHDVNHLDFGVHLVPQPKLQRHMVTHARTQRTRQQPRQHHALRGHGDRAALLVHHPHQPGVRAVAGERGVFAVATQAHPHRLGAVRLGRHHARHAVQVLHHTEWHRALEADQHIALLHLAKLHVHDVGNGIEPERARDLQRHRQCNAGHGQGGAQRAALKVADHHHGAGAHPVAQAQALDQRRLESGRRRGQHGLCGLEPHHGVDCRPGAHGGSTGCKAK